MSQQNEFSTVFRLMNNLNKEMKRENEKAIKESAKELYKIKESFKNAGFTEVESFNLLQTLIRTNTDKCI